MTQELLQRYGYLACAASAEMATLTPRDELPITAHNSSRYASEKRFNINKIYNVNTSWPTIGHGLKDVPNTLRGRIRDDETQSQINELLINDTLNTRYYAEQSRLDTILIDSHQHNDDSSATRIPQHSHMKSTTQVGSELSHKIYYQTPSHREERPPPHVGKGWHLDWGRRRKWDSVKSKEFQNRIEDISIRDGDAVSQKNRHLLARDQHNMWHYEEAQLKEHVYPACTRQELKDGILKFQVSLRMCI